MGISNFWYQAGGAWGGASVSLRVAFGRQYGLAQTSMSICFDDVGNNGIGISAYEVQPEVNGPVIPTNIPFDPAWGYPPSINADNLTSVTAEINTSDNNGMIVGTLTVFLFE